MNYLQDYRKKDLILAVSQELKAISKKNITLMEVCGGHTAAIHRFGLSSLLPPKYPAALRPWLPRLRIQPAFP